jgi:phage head maturation protease
MIAALDSAVGGRTLAVDADTLTVRAVISTADPDRAGDVVVPSGLRNVAEYLRNPVVLWAHSRTLPPIGVCRRLEVQPHRVIAETQFAKGVPFAEDLFRLYALGVLRGWSIGFLPLKAQRLPDNPDHSPPSRRRGLRIEEWDLLEYSAVPVPENAGALTLALQKGLVEDDLLRDWLLRVPNDAGKDADLDILANLYG